MAVEGEKDSKSTLKLVKLNLTFDWISSLIDGTSRTCLVVVIVVVVVLLFCACSICYQLAEASG